MLKKTLGVMALACLFGLASCSDENPWTGESGRGAINLTVQADGAVKEAVPGTRAVDKENLFNKPEAHEFSIRLEKADGSYNKTFDLLEDFKEESETKGFPTGSYTLTAFHGKADNVGFENDDEKLAHFIGTATVNVLEGRTAPVTVNAKLSQALVSLEYTETFRDYFKSYNATLQTQGRNIEFGTVDDKAAFIMPGDVGILVDVVNPQGQEVTLHPADFKASGACHYNVKMDVKNGNRSEFALSVIFENDLEREEVTIDLTEELFAAPEPVVEAEGFTDGSTIDFMAGSTPADSPKYRFNLISHGGIKTVKLTLSPLFSEPFDLISADAATQSKLANLGVDVKGIYKQADQFAFIDFTNLFKRLGEGTYAMAVEAVDGMMRTSNAVNVTLKAVAPNVNVVPENASYGFNSGTLLVTYNGSNPSEDITFKAQNANGIFVEAPVQGEPERITRTRSIEDVTYRFTIQLPDTRRNTIPVEVYLFGTMVQEVSLPVVTPEFTLDSDALAHEGWIKVIPAESNQTALITENLYLFDENGKAVSIESRNNGTGIITVKGLEAGKQYKYKASLSSVLDNKATEISFTTETEVSVPNGDFSQMAETINIPKIQDGSTYWLSSVLKKVYTNYSSISVFTPEGWNSVNDITCNQGIDQNSSGWNTWYVVPSTLGDQTNGKVTVRTVGYSHNGRDLDGSLIIGGLGGVYYGRLSPNPEDLQIKAGELSLGGSTGVSFPSRPSVLSFDYEFNGYQKSSGTEQAKAEVTVFAGSEKIASGSYIISQGQGTGAINLSGYGFKKKATAVAIKFVSSTEATPGINIPTGEQLKDNTASVGNVTVPTNEYKAFSKGSELVVSNVKFTY